MADRPYDFVLFDLGGVLVDLRPKVAEQAWARAGLGGRGAEREMDASGAKPRGDVGELDSLGMAKTLAAHLGRPVALDTLRAVWGAYVCWRPWVDRLLDRVTLPYGVLSNIDPIHAEALGPLRGARPHVTSDAIGVVKPSAAAFERAVEAIGHPPGRIRFVDDTPGNVSAARLAGLDAHHVTDLPALEAALRDALRAG